MPSAVIFFWDCDTQFAIVTLNFNLKSSYCRNSPKNCHPVKKI